MSRMTYMRSWKSLRLTSHTWLGLNPQIGRPLSRIVVALVYFFLLRATSGHPNTKVGVPSTYLDNGGVFNDGTIQNFWGLERLLVGGVGFERLSDS
jgi:hypothetical protein